MVSRFFFCLVTLVTLFFSYSSVNAAECVSGTGNDATIIFPASFEDASLVEGDVLMAYTTNGLCVGSLTWSPGKPVAMAVWGDNDQTSEIDGLAPGETIRFAIIHKDASTSNLSFTFTTPGKVVYAANEWMVANSAVITPSESTNQVYRGDLDSDQHVDILDVVHLFQILRGTREADIVEKRMADVYPFPQGDGVLDSNDMNLLVESIVTAQWPDETSLNARGIPKNEAATSEKPQLTVRVESHQTTVSVDSETPVVGVQLELKIAGAELTEQVTRQVESDVQVFSAMRADGTLGLLAYEKDGNPLPATQFALTSLLGDQLNPEAVTIVRSIGVDENENRINLPAEVTGRSTTASEETTLPLEYALSAAYPNPFNPQTNFTLSLVESQQVRIDVYDVRGARITTLYNGLLAAGTQHPFTFEASGFSSGIYFIVASGEHFNQSRTVTLLK